MLYNIFRVVMFFCAVTGLMSMIDKGDTSYIIFPIATIIWSIYSAFEPEYEEYERRNYFDTNPNYSYYEKNSNNQGHHIQLDSNNNKGGFFSPIKKEDYKSISKKCKRNFKVTIEK